jgi:hypothetical protein
MYEPKISEPSYPHGRLLEEVLLRLFKGQKTDGWECHPQGGSWSDAWGSAQWVDFTDPDGRRHTLRVQVLKG